ncbi:MAG: hypothetical protein GY771_05430, partial [bacterium]|nr:hypothetical protein [bacterium]
EVITDDGTTYIFDEVCWSYTAEIRNTISKGMTVGESQESEPPEPYLPEIRDILELFWQHPNLNNYYHGEINPDNEWQDQVISKHPSKNNPYTWALTKILSPDYVDVNDNGEPDDGDYGSWVKTDYDLPVNTGYTGDDKGYFYVDENGGPDGKTKVPRFETRYSHIKSEPEIAEPPFLTSHLIRRVDTWTTFAVVESVETPTHIATFDTSWREGADTVTKTSNSSGIRHLKKLDSIELKTVNDLGGNKISEVDFNYLDRHEALCYDDIPVCEEYGGQGFDFVGGKLTLKSVETKGRNDATIPKYYFDYAENIEGMNPDWYEAKCFYEDKFGYASLVYNLEKIYLPTGGLIDIGYEWNENAFWQHLRVDNPTGPGEFEKWFRVMGLRSAGGGRVSWITTFTGILKEPGSSEYRTIEYGYDDGVFLRFPLSPKKYCPAAVTYRDDYIAHAQVTWNTYITDHWLEKYNFAEEQPSNIRDVGYTRYTTAKEFPDAERLTDGFDIVRMHSNEWKRGLVLAGGRNVHSDHVEYSYDMLGITPVGPADEPGLILDYNPHYYAYELSEKRFMFVYAPGWPRLIEKRTYKNDIMRKEQFKYDYFETQYVMENEEWEVETYNNMEKANGRPNLITYYKNTYGNVLSMYRDPGTSVNTILKEVGSELAASVYDRIRNEDISITGSPMSIFRNYISEFKNGVIATFSGEEAYLYKRLVYAYDVEVDNDYHKEPSNPVYRTMYNTDESTYGESKNMVSALHREIAEYPLDQPINDAVITYRRHSNGGGYQIYPHETWQLLKYGQTERYIISHFNEYDNWGNLLRVTDPLGRETSAVYDYAKHSLPTSITNAKGFTTNIEYDDTILAIDRIIDPNDLATDYIYDDLGRLVEIYYPNNPIGTATSPSLEYDYYWRPDTGTAGFFNRDNEPDDFCHITTKTLVSNSPSNPIRYSTQFYDGIGEIFRNVVRTGTGSYDGIYSDTAFYDTGDVKMSYTPYQADSWDDALPLPYRLYYDDQPGDKHTTGDGRYIPFAERLPKFSGGPCHIGDDFNPYVYHQVRYTFRPSRTAVVFHPDDEYKRNYMEYHHGQEDDFPPLSELLIRRFSAISEQDGNVVGYWYGEIYENWYMKNIDGEGRIVTDIYDEFDNLLSRGEGSRVIDVRWKYQIKEFSPGWMQNFLTGIEWDDDGSGFIPIETQYTYDKLNRLTNVLDARDFNHNFTYDSLGRLRTAEDSDRGLTQYGYDDVGNLTAFADAELSDNNSQVSYFYDELNRLLSENVSLLSIPTYGTDDDTDFSADLDIFGSQVGLYNSNKLNVGGGVLSGIPPDCGPDGHFAYLDYTEETKAEYFYDAYELPLNNTGPDSESPEPINSVGSDAVKGKLVRVEDKIGEKTLHYDDMGRVIQIDENRMYFDNNEYSHEYEYNTIGDLIEETYPSGLRVEYQYDSIGRLKNIPGFFGEEAPPGGILLGDENDAKSVLGSERTFSRKNAGIAARTLPSVLARNVTRDSSSGLKEELRYHGISPLMGQVFDGFEYDDFGRLEQINANNGVNTEFVFDQRQLVTGLHLQFIEEPVHYNFFYDDSLQVNEIVDNLFTNTIDDEEFERKREFTYDRFNRLEQYQEWWTPAAGGTPPAMDGLVGVSTPTNSSSAYSSFGNLNVGEEKPIRDITYDYDPLGNRLSYVDNLTPETFSYTYNGDNNRMLSDPEENDYVYDARGAITSKGDLYSPDGDHTSYEYDYAGRIVGIQKHHFEEPLLGKGNDETAPDINNKDSASLTGGNTDNELSGRGKEDKTGIAGGSGVSLNDESPGSSLTGENSVNGDKDIGWKGIAASVEETVEAWDFTYDGGGARILKEGPNTSSKYIYDATGRLITEFSNDFTKSSGNVIKNAGFEVSSADIGTSGVNEIEGNEETELAGGSDNIDESSLNDSEESEETELNDGEKGISNSQEEPVFGEWSETITGEAGEAGIYLFDVGESGPEGETAAYLKRIAESGDLYLYQNLELVAGRTYEVRFWAKQEDLISDAAYVELRAPTAAPPGEETVLESIPITEGDWTEYRIPFVLGSDYENIKLVLEIEEGSGNMGTAFFDRVTVSEYLNDTANPSFEIVDSIGGEPDFADWEETLMGMDDSFAIGEGLVSENSANLNRTGSADGPYLQQDVLMPGETHEISFYAKATTNVPMGDPPIPVCDIIWNEEGPASVYSIDFEVEEMNDGWSRYVGYYTAQPMTQQVPPDPIRAIRLGAAGDSGTVSFEDVAVKPVSDVVDGGDMEEYVHVGQFPEDEDYDFVGWEEDRPDEFSKYAPDTIDVLMNEASIKVSHMGVPPDPATEPVTMTQQIPCLPGTEYEILVAYKVDGGGGVDDFERPADAFYGAICLVGEDITGEGTVPGEYWEYDGEYVEVVNSDDTGEEWVIARNTYKTTGDTLDVLVGMGQGCIGDCVFDAVIIRDLTTRRYEYIYGKGRKLAKVEYAGDVMEAQVYYYHNDLLGSPVALSDIDGETVWKGDYQPFGEDITPQVHWGNDYTYLGNEDDGGLMYFNARYYAKEHGRFMSCDPIKSVSSSLTVNPYVYCANNPISYTDPTGLSFMYKSPGKYRKPMVPSDEFDSGVTMGKHEHGFSRPQYPQGTNTSYMTNAAQQTRANSRVKILMVAISYGDVARNSQANLMSEGYKVAYTGVDIEDGDDVSLPQEEMHEIIEANISGFDVTIIAGHNPEESGKEGKLFSNFTKKFDKDIASKYTTPISDAGRIAFHICYSAKGSKIPVTYSDGSPMRYRNFDKLGDMRDWAIGAMGGDASRLWTYEGAFTSVPSSMALVVYTNPGFAEHWGNRMFPAEFTLDGNSYSGFYAYGSTLRGRWDSSFKGFMDWLEK